eukprot:gene69365-biopygen28800
MGSTLCEPVPPGYFAYSLGSTVTASFGSVSSGDCVSPRINFIAAYVCIVVATVMSTVYIVFARFDRLSFERQEIYIHPAVQRIKVFTQILDAAIAKLLAD